MAGTDEGRPRVQATATAFEIIETIAEKGGVRVTEIAAELDVAKSTVHRHLATLVDLGYLIRDGDQYDMGLQFLSLGGYAQRREEAYEKVRPKVGALAEETGESIQFMIPEYDRAVYLHRETGSDAVNTPSSRLGEAVPLHATAAGKAILSCYSTDRIDRILDRTGLPAVTDATITDRARLHEELEAVRESGVSVNREENVSGVYALGVPVRHPDGRPVGALSASGPVHRLGDESTESKLSATLLETANELELNIAYP